MAADEQISMAAAVAVVLAELDGIFSTKRRSKDRTEGFSQWKKCFLY